MNRVRWAGKTCSLTRIGRPAVLRVMRSATSTGDPPGIPSRPASSEVAESAPMVCVAPPRSTSSCSQERRSLDVVPTESRSQRLGAPHGHPGERDAVGQVDPPYLQHRLLAQDPRDPIRGGDEPERHDPAFGPDAGGGELPLDRRQAGQVLPQRLADHQPAETLPALDQSFGAQRLERPTNGDPTRLVLLRQRRLGRQHATGREFTGRDPTSQFVGDGLVADRPHELVLYLYCPTIVVDRSRPHQTPEEPWPSPHPRPSNWSGTPTRRSSERIDVGP